MFEDWENFYLIVGPSAAALIGLMFVVVTLSAGRNKKQFEAGKHLYTSPIVFHLAVVLLLSGLAVAPSIDGPMFGAITGLISIVGLGLGLRSAIGISRYRLSGEDSMFDMWWYGIVPSVAYIALGGAAVATITGQEWSATAIGLALIALLLVSIHAEWDLVTFLAPRASGSDKKG